jgi:hypothetical protein
MRWFSKERETMPKPSATRSSNPTRARQLQKRRAGKSKKK